MDNLTTFFGAIQFSLEHGHAQAIKRHINRGWDPSSDSNYAIRRCSQLGYDKLVELLLEDSRVDPSANHNFALQLAASNGHYDTVALLLKHPKCDPNANNNYAFRKAKENGHTAITNLLLSGFHVDPHDIVGRRKTL